VRWIGVSNFDVQQLRRAQAIAPVTSLQPRYSLVHREVEDKILPFCLAENIGVIVYSPMASGLLTGAMTRLRAINLPQGRLAEESSRLYGTQSLAQSGAGRIVCGRSANATTGQPGEVANCWTLRHPVVTGAIVGARNARQAEGSHAGW